MKRISFADERPTVDYHPTMIVSYRPTSVVVYLPAVVYRRVVGYRPIGLYMPVVDQDLSRLNYICAPSIYNKHASRLYRLIRLGIGNLDGQIRVLLKRPDTRFMHPGTRFKRPDMRFKRP